MSPNDATLKVLVILRRGNFEHRGGKPLRQRFNDDSFLTVWGTPYQPTSLMTTSCPWPRELPFA